MENLPTYRLTQSGPEAQEILDQVNVNTIDIEQLKRLYQALNQSEPEIIEPNDTWPVVNPEENVIYRVIDRVNTPPQYYSDYMWNGTSMVLMGQYNNAIDNEPTANSNNLVKSGGVYSFVHANGGAYDISAAHAVGGVLATYDDLADALGTNGANVPSGVRKGGMSIKYVNSSDNKYVRYNYFKSSTANADIANVENWEKVNAEPIAEAANNLIELIQGEWKHSFDANARRKMFILVTEDMIGVKMHYQISINGSTSGYAFIEVHDSTGARIENHGKNWSSESSYSLFSSTFTIPQNAAYITIYCTLSADYIVSLDSYGVIGEIRNNAMYYPIYTVSGNRNNGITFDTKYKFYQGNYYRIELKSLVNNSTATFNYVCLRKNGISLLDLRLTRVGDVLYYKADDDWQVEFVISSTAIGDIAMSIEIQQSQKDLYEKFTSLDLRLSEEGVKSISSFLGVVKKQIVPSGTVLFTNKGVKYGQNIIYSITCLDETVTGKNAYIELLDSTDTIISTYGKIYNSSTSSNYIGSFDIPLNFSKAVLRGSMSEIRIDYLCDPNIKDLFDGAGNNKIKYSPEIAKLSGILVYNIDKNDGDSSTIELLDSSDVSAGAKLCYKIKINGEPVGYNAYIAILDSDNERLAIYGKKYASQTATVYEGYFVVPDNFAKIVLRGNANMTLCYVADELINPVIDEKIETLKTEEDAKIEALQTAISSISGVNNVRVVNAVSFPNNPIVILSSGDQDATEYDNEALGYSKILKISENMYYLYYSGLGEHGSGDTAQRLCFAYSTDGFTYHRGFPQGVTPPVAGTNLIADFNIREQDIFRVLDDEYPYRMVANDTQYNMMMYKSQDAIHFDFANGKKCCLGERDCQVSAIPRGQIIKLYVRGSRTDQEHPHGTRAVAIAYCDIDGNIIAPAVSALPYNSLYQASAFALDDHREMLFPTFFNSAAPITVWGGMGGDGTQTLRCYIVNGERCDELTINTSNIITPNIDNSFYVMPGLINIGNDVYILMVTCPWYHNPTDLPPAPGYSELKLVKVNLSAS